MESSNLGWIPVGFSLKERLHSLKVTVIGPSSEIRIDHIFCICYLCVSLHKSSLFLVMLLEFVLQKILQDCIGVRRMS